MREKKKMKKWIALLLAAVIAVGSLPAAFAASRPTPVIMVPGMGAELYQNAGTEDARTVWPPSFALEDIAMIPHVLPAVRELISALIHPQADLEPLMDRLAEAVENGIVPWVEPLLCNPDGTGTDPSVDVAYHWDDAIANHPEYLDGTKGEPAVVRALCEEIGAENVYLFTYDWRLDILSHADSLHTLVEKVKADTGADRVTVVSASMGTCILSAYLDRYGSDDLQNCVFLSPAFQGVTMVGELFNRQLEIDMVSLAAYLEGIGMGNISPLIYVAGALGVFRLLDRLIAAHGDRVYDEVLIPLVANMPGLWDVMPGAYYETALRAMNITNPTMLEKLNAYHGVQERLEENLAQARENGTHVSVVAQYGFSAIPVSPSRANQTDSLIDTALASAGATCAPFGGTLGADYEQAVQDGHNHLSADQVIDASTCMLPENTWFIRGADHVGYYYDTTTMDFIVWLITAEGAVDVRTSDAYPQFMAVDESENLVGTPPVGDPDETSGTEIPTAPESTEPEEPDSSDLATEPDTESPAEPDTGNDTETDPSDVTEPAAEPDDGATQGGGAQIPSGGTAGEGSTAGLPEAHPTEIPDASQRSETDAVFSDGADRTEERETEETAAAVSSPSTGDHSWGLLGLAALVSGCVAVLLKKRDNVF